MHEKTTIRPAPVITLHAGLVALRPWRPGDAMALHDAARESIDSVGRWLPWCHAEYRYEDAVRWIEHCEVAWQTGVQYAFSIWTTATDEFVGGVGLSQIDDQRGVANLGYWVRQSQQGKGLAALAAKRLMPFGFEQLGLRRIEMRVSTTNWASQRTAETIGAHFEGIVPGGLRVARSLSGFGGRGENSAVRGQNFGDLRVHRGSMDQALAEIWTVQTDSQTGQPTSDSSPRTSHDAAIYSVSAPER